MLSPLRRGHHHEFDDDPMSARTINGHGEHWKSSDRPNASFLNNNILPDVYTPRPNSSALNLDLSRAFRVDAYLLAIVRIDDKRNSFYSAEVVSKLRQKEQTQKFINKPCSLFVTDRSFIIFDRATQIIAETIPLENVDPTCVYSDEQDTLNDIFMYRVLDRHLTSIASQASNSNSNELTHAIVFKCSNKESKLLVDNIRSVNGKPLKSSRSTRSETRSTIDRRLIDTGRTTPYNSQQLLHEPLPMNNPAYVVGPQHSSRTISQPHSTVVSTDHYRRLTEELNKCFDDIELFIRYIEAIMEYTKELERDYRRKDKKSSGLKQMVEKLPDDRYFIDILQKFKHSFNLLGELKYIIHSPNAPELIHYLLSPLQLILHTLRSKHPNQLQLAYDIWTPALTKEARELLINCLTSKEQEVLWNLGPAWIRTAEEVPQKIVEYRPLFFEGRPIWFQEPSNDYSLQSARSIDERQPSVWSSPRQPNQNNNNNGSSINHHTQFARQPSPAAQFDTSTVDRSNKTSVVENYNEHAWAIDRKRAGAKIYVVKFDRQGQNNKELTVRCGELIEIENNSKKWWRARNFHGDVGHVPHNIVDEIELEQLLVKNTSSNTSVVLPRPSSAPNRGFTHVNGHHQHNTNGYTQHLLRSPSNGNNFIMQSNSTTYTNPTIIRDHLLQQTFSPLVSSPPLAPSPPPLSIPPPPPMPSQLLTNRSSTWSTLQLPESNRKGRRSRSNTNLSTQRVDVLQQELTQRITDRIGFISPNSSKEDVQRWLASKHISTKLAQNLHGMNGEELFQLTKSTLDQFTNEHESARIYELLLQQKQLAGYRTRDIPERSPHLNNSALSSFKANTINDADDNFSLRPDDTLSRSLKIKLKQRRDRIEQAESADPIEL
ncbi:unnamed protein product [Rotaria sordida]|uniref:SH3 domain-containing protein n=1 Tax=Rotaria sordida TaxID=392033 RepID=A0A813PMF1_9BILA|nr:unnamed protein product [Rotaria sordida]